ncbi:hypothetical protein EDB84DRAFT_1520756 [Lactarius hengduanensis]|nr:hypothetical protein EDB84DRAFT_1520756 [Lactarius hengduanensis]
MQGNITLSVMVSTLLCHAMVGNHMCSSHRIRSMLTSRKVIISNRKPTTLRETPDRAQDTKSALDETPARRHSRSRLQLPVPVRWCIIVSRHHPVAGPRLRLNRDGESRLPSLCA